MYFFYDDKLDVLLINDKKEATVKEDASTEDTTASINEETVISDSESKTDNTVNSYSEEDVVSYFDSIGNEVEKSSTFKEKFKEYFITIVDFIFYEKEIKGYTKLTEEELRESLKKAENKEIKEEQKEEVKEEQEENKTNN